MPGLAKEDVFLFFSFSFFFRSRPVPVRPPATVSASFPRPLAPRQCPAKGTLSSFPAATQRHTPGGLKREERMFSPFWGPEVRNRGVVRSRSLLNPAGKSPPRPRLSRLRGSPAGLGFGPRRADLGLCRHVAVFSHGRRSLPRPAFHKDASRIGRGPALLRYDRLNRSHPQWLYFQRRSHSEARGVRTSARLTFWRGRSRLNPPQGHRQRDSGEEARGRGVPFPGVGSVSVPLFFHRRPQPS